MRKANKTIAPTKDDLNQVIPALYGGMNVTLGGKVLPKPGDDLEWEFGMGLYPKMLQEPILAACNDILKILVLEAEPCAQPNIKMPESESEPDFEALMSEHERSKEVSDYVEDLLKNKFEESLRTIFWQMLDSYAFGSKLGEKVFGMVDGSVQVVNVKPKSRKMYSLVVDPFYSVLGIKSGVTNIGLSYVDGAPAFDDTTFPIDRFWLMTPRLGEDGDPRGQSALRACYAPWYEKLLTRPESLKYMKQFGGGMVSLELPPITQGNTKVKLSDGTEIDKTVLYQTLLSTFATNGGAFTLENGSKLNVHTPNGEGKAFEAKFDRCDREMVLAFLKQVRAILEAQHGSKADSETSLDLLGSLVNWLRQVLCESFATVIRTIVQLAFGSEAVAKYLPRLVMEEAKEQDIPALLTAISTALAAGTITPEQMPFWDRRIGQPVRSSDWQPEAEEEEDAPDEGAQFRRKAEEEATAKRKRLSTRYAAAAEPLSGHR